MSATNSKLIKGATGDWEVVIGMEVHAQVTSNAKLFSGASTEFGGEPNSHVSLVDAAMPGMLPVINEECVRQAVRTGLGLNAKINLRSVFDRKNYFYPDSPQGYQISQYKSPVVGEGVLVVELAGGESVTVGIERLHLEQDAGKLLHDQSPTMSFVDLNRSGVALMEIVSKPDIRSSEQAKAYVTKLRSILRYLGTCDGDMEKGSLRADVNVSVRKPGEALGTRCEIKNMNSIAFIGEAIESEARRQIKTIEEGGTVDQETRLYDPNTRKTRSMRSKEEAHDYRYFPDPDLLPLEFSEAYVAELKASLPELPDQKMAGFIAELGLPPYDASVLVAEPESARFYEAVLANLKDPRNHAKVAANWVINELFGRLNKEGMEISASPVSAEQLAAIIELALDGTINGKQAKDLFDIVWQKGGDPRALVETLSMKQVTDVGAIEMMVEDVVTANTAKVEDAKTNPNTIGWFVGQVMKSSKGKANPQTTTGLLRTRIFENWARSQTGPLQRGERLYDYYDQSARKGYEELRSILNLWASEVDDSPYRDELISRMTRGGNAAFRAALAELVIYDLLVRLGHKISVHPVIPGARRRPDFALADSKGRVSAYIEVTTVNRPENSDAETNRENVIYRAIDQLTLPKGCLLGYKLVRAGPNSPALKPLLAAIEDWAKANSERAKTEEIIERFTAADWVFELELFSASEAGAATGGIATAWLSGGALAPHKDIRAALYRKSRGYGKMDAPFIIAIADTTDQMFGKLQVRDAITEAVFGDERFVFAGDKATRQFAPNGFWRGPDGPRNTHVTALLFLPQIDIWKLRDPKWEPVLATNPWAASQTPNSLKSLTRFEADQGKWIEGKPIGDLLGLPDPWPPDE